MRSKYFTVINRVILDEQEILIEKTNILSFTSESTMVIGSIGCNGREHAIDIVTEYYINEDLVFAKHVKSFLLGKCTCGKKIGNFILTKNKGE